MRPWRFVVQFMACQTGLDPFEGDRVTQVQLYLFSWAGLCKTVPSESLRFERAIASPRLTLNDGENSTTWSRMLTARMLEPRSCVSAMLECVESLPLCSATVADCVPETDLSPETDDVLVVPNGGLELRN